MNAQKITSKSSIEWTRIRNADGSLRLGFTWNPTGGCLHGCTWQMPDGKVTECYAKTVAERFTSAYDRGFEAHYWRPHALNEPLRVKTPAGIFVGSMADLFGHWVPEEQIQQVIEVMRQADWHIFQTLSKYPIRLSDFNPYPANVWVGVSLPAGHLMKPIGATRALSAYLRQMTKIEASTRFMSIEPLWFDVAPVFEEWLENNERLPFEWAIIGAASNGLKQYPPDENHLRRLLNVLDGQGIPVFFKGNLKSLAWAKDNWREEFPLLQAKPQQMELF